MEHEILEKTYSLLRKSSDRTAGILAGAIVEEMLTKLLKSVVIEGLTRDFSKELIGKNGPLNSFYNKALVAFSFGLVDEQEYHLMEIVRKIRNKCAHDLATDPSEDIALSESPFSDFIKEIIPQRMIEELPTDQRREFHEVRESLDSSNARNVFDYFVSLTTTRLLARIAIAERRTEPPLEMDDETSREDITDDCPRF